MKKIILLLVGISVFIVFILAIGVDFNELYSYLLGVDPRYYLVAIILDVGFMTSYATAWYFLVRSIHSRVRIKDILFIVLVGWFGDMVVPAAFVTGEAIRLYLLNKLYGIDYSKGFATILIHRLMSALSFVMFIILGLIFLVEGGTVVGNEMIKQALFGVSLAFIAIVSVSMLIMREDITERIVLEFVKRFSKYLDRWNLRERVLDSLKGYKESITVLKTSTSNLLLGFFSMIIQWLFGISIPYVIFQGVGYRMSFWALAVAYPLYGLADNIPLGIPVNAGILDAAMTSMFILLGAPKEIALSVTLLTRSIIVLFEAVVTGSITLVYVARIIGEIRIDNVKKLLYQITVKD